MDSTAKRECPGCGRRFLPGGYTNHLRLTRDPRCKSFRNSIFHPPSSTFSHQDAVPTPGPPHAPFSPTNQPSHVPDDLDPDIEMSDVGGGDQDIPPADYDMNLSTPDQPAGADGHSTDELDSPDELLDVHPHCPSSHPFTVTSDTDSDLSDDEDNSHQSNHREPLSSPIEFFSFVLAIAYIY